MNYLLDTHVLLWAGSEPERLSKKARELIEDEGNRLFFSVASLWEVVIKAALGRAGFSTDAGILRLGLVATGFEELEIRAEHALAVAALPPLHSDPFDRMLVAQAIVEDLKLVTADARVAAYDAPIVKV